MRPATRHYHPSSGDQRARAIVAVALVHLVIGAAILRGLDVAIVHRAVERLQTFDIRPDQPPPPELPATPAPQPDEAAPEAAAPANERSRPTPVVVPVPPVPLPIERMIPAARDAGPEGPDRTAGAAATPGPGTGAGGAGTGLGGGGPGGAGGGGGGSFTPAQRIGKVPDSAYRQIVAVSGARRGSVGITLKVNVDGRPSNCRIARTSGNPQLDGLMCQLALDHVRFRPARDPDGNAVAQDVTLYPDWSPR